jgi:hypothetical protein
MGLPDIMFDIAHSQGRGISRFFLSLRTLALYPLFFRAIVKQRYVYLRERLITILSTYQNKSATDAKSSKEAATYRSVE